MNINYMNESVTTVKTILDLGIEYAEAKDKVEMLRRLIHYALPQKGIPQFSVTRVIHADALLGTDPRMVIQFRYHNVDTDSTGCDLAMLTLEVCRGKLVGKLEGF